MNTKQSVCYDTGRHSNIAPSIYLHFKLYVYMQKKIGGGGGGGGGRGG